MSTHRLHHSPWNKHSEDGNHNLLAAVIALTAILSALIMYTFVFLPHQRIAQKKIPTQTPSVAAAAQTPDTPTGRTSFVGVIKEDTSNRLTVRTTLTRNGTTQEQLLLVTTTAATVISQLDQLKTGVGSNPSQPRTKTPATLSDLKAGASITVTADSIIDNQASVTATAIDIITPAT